MKLVHFVPSFGFGGAEQVAAGQVVRFRTAGHQARIIALQGGACQLGLERAIDGPVEGPAATTPDRINRRDAARLAAYAARRIDRGEVLHAHLPDPDRLGCALVARKMVPCVVTFHLFPAGSERLHDLLVGPWYVQRALVRASARFTNLVFVALTEHDRRRLAREYPQVRVESIPNASALSREDHFEPLPFGRGARLIAVGRLCRQKGFDRLLDLLAAEPIRARSWSLCVLGEGEERGVLEQQAARLGIGDRVKFVGWRPAQQAMKEADLFISTSGYEGMPLALIEAMAAEVPVLASSIPPHCEMLDGIEGSILEGPPEAWPPQLARLLDDGSLRRSIATTSAARARSRYSVERHDALYHELYEDVRRRGRERRSSAEDR